MGKYDDLTADLPPVSGGSSGRFDDLLSDLPPSTSQMGGKPPLGFVASQTLGMAPWNKVNVAFKSGVGNFAEFAGKHTNLDPTQIGAALTPVAMLPEILGATSGWQGIQESENPVIQGLTKTPQELSPQFNPLHEAAGISKNLPETRGNVARFPNLGGQPSSAPPPFAPAIAPKYYPQNTNAMLNFARSRMEGLGEKLSPQELNDYRTIIGQMIDTGKVGSGTPLADASQLKDQATKLLTNQVQGLADLHKAYAISKTVQNPSQMLPQTVVELAKKYGPWIASAASAIGIGRHL